MTKLPPGSSRLTKREIDVAKRLREARRHLGLSQSAVATKIQITRDALASYERFRAPLKYIDGFCFCADFRVSLNWLATGEGKIDSSELDSMPISIGLDAPSNMSFGTAFDKFLKPYVAVSKLGPAHQTAAKVPNIKQINMSKTALKMMVDFWERTVPEYDIEEFVRLLWREGEQLRNSKKAARMRAYLRTMEVDTDPTELFRVDEPEA